MKYSPGHLRISAKQAETIRRLRKRPGFKLPHGGLLNSNGENIGRLRDMKAAGKEIWVKLSRVYVEIYPSKD
jgi:hypothetical protein